MSLGSDDLDLESERFDLNQDRIGPIAYRPSESTLTFSEPESDDDYYYTDSHSRSYPCYECGCIRLKSLRNPSQGSRSRFIDLDSRSKGSSRSNMIVLNKSRSRSRSRSRSESTPYQLWILTFFAAIGGLLFGYDTGVVSGAMLLLKKEFSLSPVWQELIVSITIGTAAVFSFISGFLNDRFGRKVVILLASFFFTVGALILGTAQNRWMLLGGRALLGACIGFASMTIPIYIAECSPSHLRGRLVTINTLFITGGQCIAGVLDGAFSYIKPDGWRYMLGLAGLPALIQFIGFLFLPESPRWLMKQRRENEAKAVLNKLRDSVGVDEELMEMRSAVQSEMAFCQEHEKLNLYRVLKSGPMRRAVIVGCGLQLFQQLSGINTVMYYSATIIKMAGVSNQHTAIWLSAVTAVVNFVFTILGIWLVERLGRRKLILSSLFGVTLSLVLLAVSFQLAAVYSPVSADRIPQNSSCALYQSCSSCIRDSDCGFCYSKTGSHINGSCLLVDKEDKDQARFGLCQQIHPSLDWAFEYCPSSYSWMAIFGLVLYLAFFAPGMGPMPWTINSEIYPLWARSTCTSLATATNWIANLLVSMTFLSLIQAITQFGTYWFFMGICIVAFTFIWLALPETKGQNLEEVDNLFLKPWCSCCKPARRPPDAQYKSLINRTIPE